MHPGVLQFLIIMVAFFLRKGYHELFRLRVKNMRWLNYGDLLVGAFAAIVTTWVMVEVVLIMQGALSRPTPWLMDWLNVLLKISLVGISAIVFIGWLCRIRLPDFIIGIGRGLVTYSTSIALLSLWCWLPSVQTP
jgi:hypothetical protein